MTEKRKRLIMCYTKVLKNFKPEEVQDTLIKLFGCELWNKFHKQFKKRGVLQKSEMPRIVSFCFQMVTTECLEAKLLDLQLSDVIFRSNKRKWNAFQLSGKKNTMFLSERGLKKAFLEIFKKLNMQFDIKITTYKEIVWIGLSNYNTKKYAPIFIAYFLGEDVMFSTRRAINGKLMQAVSTALKYEALKRVNLDGFDLWSLFKMMKQKDSHAVEALRKKSNYENLDQGLPMNMGVDYTRKIIRKAALEECLGKNPPILNTITIKSESGLRVKRWLPEMEGYPAKATFRITHPNLPEFLKELAEKNILVEPMPHYLKSFPVAGKNTIYLKEATSRV